MGRARGTLVVTAVLVVVGVSLVGCSSGGDDAGPATTLVELTGDVVRDGDDTVGEVAMAPQRSTGEVVEVAQVSITGPQGGYAVVYRDGAGAPGEIIGVSDLLPTGVHDDVVVRLREPLVESGSVWVMVHDEDTANTTFDYPDGDGPASTSSGVTVVSVAVEVVPG